jgi:hypothetical protein
MVPICILNQKCQFGELLEGLVMEDVGIHILWRFGLSYGHLVFLWPFGIFVAIWHILCSLGVFIPVLLCCTKKNLATLQKTRVDLSL